MEYGTPHATFSIQGTVSSESNIMIPGIRVVMERDTVHTDMNGNYLVRTGGFPIEPAFLVEYLDVDGSNNNSYQASDTLVSFKEAKFEGGDDSWYSGEATIDVNIVLKEDSDEI